MNYYKTIGGKKMDANILAQAEASTAGAKDNLISKADAQSLIKAVKDGGKVTDIEATLQQVEANYVTDAYHSLSIEGYRVSEELIRRVATGDWSPDAHADDQNSTHTMAAHGYWLAHNAILYSDPLEFYHGIGSAKYIQKQMPYPGSHDWSMAIRQFSIATKAVLGWPLIAMSALGLILALKHKQFWPLVFASLAPVYYVINLYGGDSPIYIPDVYPFSHYNSRYALAALPLFAICTAALASALPRLRFILPLIALSWPKQHRRPR